MKTDNDYRVEHDKIYRYDEERRAYIYAGRLFGRTIERFIEDTSRESAS